MICVTICSACSCGVILRMQSILQGKERSLDLPVMRLYAPFNCNMGQHVNAPVIPAYFSVSCQKRTFLQSPSPLCFLKL